MHANILIRVPKVCKNMYTLSGNNLTFFLVNGLYKIGRIFGDIVLKHPSISRKHAEIEIRNDGSFLRDCNSKYSTQCNGKILLVNEEVKLKDEVQIKFGELTFNFHKMDKIVTCATGLKGSEEDLASIIEQLGGTYLKEWNETCSYLTTNEILISIKFLHAIMDNKKIVTLQFWKEYLKNIKSNKLPPDPAEFYPPFGEHVINSKHLEYNPARKEIFKGKVFAFWTKKRRVRMHEIIKKAGGDTVLLVKNTSDEEELLKLMDKYIAMDPEDPSIEKTFFKALTAYKNKGKRLIPVQEVVFAILQCSCEENCNPNFNRTHTVFLKETEKKHTAKALIEESQETQHDVKSSQHFSVIPASYEEPLIIADEISVPAKRIKLDPDIVMESTSKLSAIEKSPLRELSQETIKLEPDDYDVTQERIRNNRRHGSFFKRPNDDVVAFPSKKIKVEEKSSKINPFSVLNSSAFTNNPFSSMVKNECDLDQSNNLFEQKNLQDELKTDEIDSEPDLIFDVKDSGIEKNKSKVDINIDNCMTEKNVELVNNSRNTKTRSKKVKYEVRESSVNFSMLKPDISEGIWLYASVQEELKPTNSDLSDKEKEWCDRFNESVSIVVKSLIKRDNENVENSLRSMNYSTNMINFKKFRKSFVPKSKTVIGCSKFEHTGSNLAINYGNSDEEDNRKM
ncbi:hypothetical protein HHI36_012561 [Cryptolaemus montrouzieri]|uniref:FHA domain-containing protein n=1 Tax=Cryptolaemus montrouzieri TaxID=559131 RepID=A0ABD2NG12_9CUCU